MSIRFELPKITFSTEEGEQIQARQDVLVGMDKDLVDKIMDQGIAATQSSAWNPPNKWGIDRVRRIRDWVHLAISDGYPSVLNLWYYDRRAVFLYVQLKVNLNDLSTDRELERKNMTLGTAGALPFDGDTGAPEHLPWRHYLFREILAKCRGKDSDAIYAITGDELSRAEDEILRTIAEVQHEIQRSAQMQNVQAPMPIGPKTTLTGSDSAALGGAANAFLKHFRALLNDPQSLYNTYTRYTQASYGLWGSF